jgi:hypothetical protein
MGDLTVTRWRAWFVGGDTLDGQTFADWQALPDDGVLSVMLWFADGTRRVMQGNDFYFVTPNGVFGHNDHPQEETERRYPGASVKRGMWTTDAEMNRVAAEAMGAE